MTRIAPVESLISTIRSPEPGADIFANEQPLVLPGGLYAAFGGGLLGQSATAAAATVAPAFRLYSVQSTFLRPVRSDGGKISYHVDRTADGRTYATRIVRATQASSDKCIYVGILSFQRGDVPAANVLSYGVAMPDVVGGLRPEDLPKAIIQQQATATDAISGDAPQLQPKAEEEPFDWRILEGEPADNLTESRHRAFVRSPAVSSDDASVHLAALAYLSDTYMLATALDANPATVGQKIRDEVAMGASLTHNVSLHDPTARIDEWLFGERTTSWGADGRVLVHQRFWSVRTGRLVMSGSQEGLLRLKDVKL